MCQNSIGSCVVHFVYQWFDTTLLSINSLDNSKIRFSTYGLIPINWSWMIKNLINCFFGRQANFSISRCQISWSQFKTKLERRCGSSVLIFILRILKPSNSIFGLRIIYFSLLHTIIAYGVGIWRNSNWAIKILKLLIW